jgi:hypothetical protein
MKLVRGVLLLSGVHPFPPICQGRRKVSYLYFDPDT